MTTDDFDAPPTDDADEALSMREETLLEDGYLRRSA